MKKIIFYFIALVIGIAVGFFAGNQYTEPQNTTNLDNNTTVKDDTNKEIVGNENITLYYPFPEQKISSPLVIKGKAKGTWFFEGDFPVVLTNWDGLIIAEGHVTAQGEWMTEGFVDFMGELEFTKPDFGDRGSLILQKDNPSGLPENDEAFEITIFF